MVTSKTKKSPLLSAKRLLADKTPTPPDIITSFVPGRCVVLLAGPGGDGKSYAMLDLAFAVARGEKWLGLDSKKMPVLIIDLENRKYRLRDRVHELMSGHKLQTAPDVYFALEFNAGLCRDEATDEIVKLATDCGAGLIILDSLVDFYGDLDENSNTEMGKAARRLRTITDRINVSIIAIHHTPKNDKNTPRGATALRNGVDVCVLVSRDQSTLTLRQDKNRCGREVTVTANLNWGESRFWLSHIKTFTGRQQRKPKIDPDEMAILEILDSGGWRQSNEVVKLAAKKVKKAQSTLTKKLAKMCENKVLERGSGDKGKPYPVRVDQFTNATLVD